MATKDCDLPSKGKTKAFDNSISNHGDQYSNLNLNKPHQCVDNNYGHSTSNSIHNKRKGYDFTDKKDSKAKTSISSWKKDDQKHKSFESLNAKDKQESEKSWKKDRSSNKTSSSTLSLHIAAYEISFESEKADKNGIELPAKEKGKFKNVEHALTGNNSSSLNQFEIPRQQTNVKSEPEIMQFKTSQKLLNPNEIGSSQKQVSAKDCTTRACLGRTAQIGDIYDVRTEQLVAGANIFGKELPSDIICIENNHSITSEFISSNKISDKFAALDLNGELVVSVLTGMIEGSGSIECIYERPTSKESVQNSFIQKIQTLDEKININDKKLKALIAPNIGELGGTHVIVGISWGTNAVVSVTCGKNQDELKVKIEDQLTDEFKMLNVEDSGLAEMAVKVFADMNPTGLELPTTLKEAKQYLNTMAESFVNCKGKQMQLHLLPLKVVQQIFELQDIGDRVNSVNLEMSIIKKLEHFFDTLFRSSVILQNLVKCFADNGEYIATEEKDAIKGFANNFDAAIVKMCDEMSAMVQKVRSGNAEAYEIDVLRAMFEKDPLISPSQIGTFVESYNRFTEKLGFVSECQQNGILMITDAVKLAKVKDDNPNTEILLLFSSFKNDHSLPEWTESVTMFSDIQKQRGTKLLAVVDTDVLPNIAKNESLPDGIRIVQYFNGQYLSKDYLKLQKKLDSQCLVACDNVHPSDEVDIKAVPINFPCPKCSNGTKEWGCVNCRQEIEYNFDGKFYCGCGFNTVDEYAFKCSDPMHGNDYCKFKKETLDQLVKNIKPIPEVNILVIGETGVGKSTWINALANYISHDSIEEVLKNDFINLIPTQFELTEKHDGEILQKSIRVGKSENENFTEGQSSTQHAKAYAFRHNKCYYRIIDTPGIGDSRGIEQDKQNMENIMQFISLYKEIHGICILMKPNEARLTPSFEFCFKELLVQFHRSALENIVFCFTQTSGFNFEVGQTLTPLNVLLNEIKKKRQISIPTNDERMYAFDNMAYRYLCAVKNSDFQFAPDQHELYKRSYNISRDVTRKMLHYFLNRKAHNVEESISIYRARNVIRRLTRPMAMINAAMEETLEKVKDKQNLIKRFSHDEAALRKILVKKIVFKRWRIDSYNEYYCGTCSTIDYYYGDDRLQFVEAYPSAMDKNPFAMIVANSLFKKKKDKCPNCGPNTKAVFSNRWLISEMGTREEEDVTVAGQMKEKLESRQGIQEEIEKVQKLKEELIAENDAIVKASARFAHFLAKYSITTYNDATEKYLKLLIKREERMGNESKKIIYENLLSQYDAEKITLEKQLKTASKFGDTSIKTSDIMEIVDGLKKLKHYGRDIAQAIGECNKAILYEASDKDIQVCLPKPRMTTWEAFNKWMWEPVKRY